jgi:hypothetical protein
MARPAAIVVSIVLWAIGLVPATLIAMWIGLAEFTWAGAFKAFGMLAVLVGLFELLRGRIESIHSRRNKAKA